MRRGNCGQRDRRPRSNDSLSAKDERCFLTERMPYGTPEGWKEVRWVADAVRGLVTTNVARPRCRLSLQPLLPALHPHSRAFAKPWHLCEKQLRRFGHAVRIHHELLRRALVEVLVPRRRLVEADVGTFRDLLRPAAWGSAERYCNSVLTLVESLSADDLERTVVLQVLGQTTAK